MKKLVVKKLVIKKLFSVFKCVIQFRLLVESFTSTILQHINNNITNNIIIIP